MLSAFIMILFLVTYLVFFFFFNFFFIQKFRLSHLQSKAMSGSDTDDELEQICTSDKEDDIIVEPRPLAKDNPKPPEPNRDINVYEPSEWTPKGLV